MSASSTLEPKASCTVEVEGLTKDWGHTAVLRGVNLRVASNSCVTILGPNGAGKTTLLRILATLSRPSGGRVRVDGLDLQDAAQAVRQRIGFVSHQTFLYGELSCLENLRFYGRMYGVRDLENRTDELLEQFGLADRREDPVRTLSRGMQQRLSLTRALLHRPEILLLDEPYASLDQHGADALMNSVGELRARGCTILLTTHDWQRGAQMADQVALLVAGKIVYEERGQTLSWEQLHATYLRHTQERT
jgi:heme exporter protein A